MCVCTGVCVCVYVQVCVCVSHQILCCLDLKRTPGCTYIHTFVHTNSHMPAHLAFYTHQYTGNMICFMRSAYSTCTTYMPTSGHLKYSLRLYSSACTKDIPNLLKKHAYNRQRTLRTFQTYFKKHAYNCQRTLRRFQTYAPV